MTEQERCCLHDSDCKVHNAPALPVGRCDCGVGGDPPHGKPASISFNDKCTKCGESLRRAMLIAMLSDAGTQVHIDCPNGGEHEF